MAEEQRCGYANCASQKSVVDLKRCAGCRLIRYCSPNCQKAHWELHVFDCKTGKPISTVYYLARDVRRHIVPVHHQTRKDYGFDKAERTLGSQGEILLAMFYLGLIENVPLPRLRMWQQESRLAEGISAVFAASPLAQKAGPYEWFLEHQYLFDGSVVDPDTGASLLAHSVITALHNVWPYVGGDPSDTYGVMFAKSRQLSQHQQTCLFFVAVIRSGNPGVPAPDKTTCLEFGFVAEQVPYINLAMKYAELLNRCSFAELCDAYATSSIADLFARCGIVEIGHNALFKDVMSGSPYAFKPIWHLKFYIQNKLAGSSPYEVSGPAPCVVRDYGYNNCKTPEEFKLLDELYTHLLVKCVVDPLSLHAACVAGHLLDFAKAFMKLSPFTAKYTRLLKSDYPPATSSCGQ